MNLLLFHNKSLSSLEKAKLETDTVEVKQIQGRRYSVYFVLYK